MGATGTVGKKELCAHLGWSRPTLDKRLKVDPKFPVVRRGDQSGGWAFDKAKVDAYLAGVPAALDRAQLADAVKPALPRKAEETARQVVEALKNAPQDQPKPARRSAHHEGEASARQRKDAAQADLLEDRRAKERGALVDAEALRQVLTTMLARLGKGLDATPEQIVRQFDLPDTAVGWLRAFFDDQRTQMVRDCEAVLTPADAVP